MTTKAKPITFNPFQFGYDFLKSDQHSSGLVMSAVAALTGFPDKKAMDKAIVSDIQRGFRAFHVESRIAKRDDEYVKNDKGTKLIPLHQWLKSAKNGKADAPTVKLDIAAAIEMTRVQLDAVDDKPLHAAYVQIREDASKAVSNAWRAMALKAQASSGKPRASGRGRNRLLGEAVAAFLDSLVKRAKLRREAGDATAPDDAAMAQWIADSKASFAALTAK